MTDPQLYDFPVSRASGKIDQYAEEIKVSRAETPLLVFATRAGNTRRFVRRLTTRGLHSYELPWQSDDYGLPAQDSQSSQDHSLLFNAKHIIIVTPSYGTLDPVTRRMTGSVPPTIEKFIERGIHALPQSPKIIGVIGTGNRTFGSDFCDAGYTVAQRLNVPMIRAIDMAGDESDDIRVISFLNHPSYA